MFATREGNEPADTARLTYSELLARVKRFGNALRSLGVRRADPVALYMPMVPELLVAMLACARIGAVHSIVVSTWPLSDGIVSEQSTLSW